MTTWRSRWLQCSGPRRTVTLVGSSFRAAGRAAAIRARLPVLFDTEGRPPSGGDAAALGEPAFITFQTVSCPGRRGGSLRVGRPSPGCGASIGSGHTSGWLIPRLAVGRIGRSFVGPSCVFASCWAAGRMSVIDRAGVVLAAGTFPIRSSLGVEVTARIRGARGSYHGLQGSGGG